MKPRETPDRLFAALVAHDHFAARSLLLDTYHRERSSSAVAEALGWTEEGLRRWVVELRLWHEVEAAAPGALG